MARRYNNKKQIVNGLHFDSKLEVKRYMFLVVCQAGGRITQLRNQVPFKLPNRTTYFADFTYFRDGKLVVEDVKCHRSATEPVFLGKKMLMLSMGYRIKLVYLANINFLDTPKDILAKSRLNKKIYGFTTIKKRPSARS